MTAIGERLQEFMKSADPERTLLEHLAAATLANDASEGARWMPDHRLNLLLAGYSGAGNVGTEMRTGEILRQLRFLLGEQQTEFTVLSIGSEIPRDVLPRVRCLELSGYIPDMLAASVNEHHGVVACEGSMFKSTFSNVFSAIMAAVLGTAARSGKLAVGYGAEVAAMDPILERFVCEHLGDALLFCRNEPSQAAADKLGCRAFGGADTAWTFDAAPPQRAKELLRGMGWNGTDPVLAVCAMNPFWWPVRPHPSMAIAGANKSLHYGSMLFHSHSPEIKRKYLRYIEQLALAMEQLCRSMSAFPIIIGMERVDQAACTDLAAKVASRPRVLMGYRYPVRDVVAVLRLSTLLISSRFHALVGAMPAAVPSVGIAMDERIRNLLCGAAQDYRLVRADDPDLAARIVAAAGRLDPDAVRTASRETVVQAVEAMGRMGMAFVEELRRVLPAFPIVERPQTWQAHLAPLPRVIEELLSGDSK